MARASCATLIVLCTGDARVLDAARMAAREAGLRLIERRVCVNIADAVDGIDEAPDHIMIIHEGVLPGLEEARRREGLYKSLDVSMCSDPRSIRDSILAAACRPLAAPCPIDVGLGWLQA